jgi:hypothetical protein
MSFAKLKPMSLITLIFAASFAFAAGEKDVNCPNLVTNSGFSPEAVVRAVESAAGEAVEIRHEPTWDGLVARLYTAAGVELAYLNYKIRNEEILTIGMVEVAEPYRRLGVTELLMGDVLKSLPQVTRIDTILLGTNSDILRQALDEKKPCTEALKLTPAYRARARFGFTEISSSDCGMIPGFSVVRP